MGKRGLFRNKKAVGSMVILEAMQLLAVMLILTSSIMYVQNKLEIVGFSKIFFARDLGLMATALHGAPGNVFQFFDISPKSKKEGETYEFGFNVSDNFVTVNATTNPGSALYWYFSSYGMHPIKFEESFGPSTGFFKIGKEGNWLLMGKKKINGNIFTCPFINTAETGYRSKKFIFDAAHGENETDKGAVNNADESFYEAKTAMDIANKIGAIELGNRFFTRESGKFATFAKRKEFISKNAEADTVIISVHAGNNPDNKINHIKAYYNVLSDSDTREKSRKLGCNIMNFIIYGQDKIQGAGKINGLAVIPSDSDYIQKIIPAGKIGVLLELGNMQVPKKDNFLADSTKLAGAIYGGAASYHSGESDE